MDVRQKVDSFERCRAIDERLQERIRWQSCRRSGLLGPRVSPVPATGGWIEVLGVTVGRIAPVQGLVHLGLSDGLTALYGLNGSGKTSLLNLLELALRGVVPDEDLEDDDQFRVESNILDVHVRLMTQAAEPANFSMPNPLLRLVDDCTRGLETKLGLEGRERSGRPLDDLVDLLDLTMRSTLLEAVAKCAPCSHDGDHLRAIEERASVWTAALREAAQQGRLTFRAFGTSSRPAWTVYLAPTMQGPAGHAALMGSVDWFTDRNRPSPRDERWHDHVFDARFPLSLDARTYLFQPSDFTRPGAAGRSAVIQVPMALLGRVDAEVERATAVDIGDGRARRWTVSNQGGLRLATVIGISAADEDPDVATMDVLLDLTGSHDYGFLIEDGGVNADVIAEVQSIEALANDLVSALLPGAPRLDFRLGAAEDWVRGLRPAWYAHDHHISKLSSAQQRWARLAIALAIARRQGAMPGELHDDLPHHPLLFLCDEPERGLHRLLEHQLARGLSSVLRTVSGVGVVATHAPDMLASTLVHPMLVTRTKDTTTLRAVPLSVVDGIAMSMSADNLGLTVGDLWALSRLTVVVEGVHDEWVFGAVLQDSLNAAVASVFPMHGATRLRSLTEAQLLVRGTDAPILVVLDEMEATRGTDLLDAVKAADSDDSRREALERLRTTKGDSYLFLHQFAQAADQLGALDRVSVHGLSLPDIICYLPVDLMLGTGAPPWESLIKRWRSSAGDMRATNLKGWLKKQKLLPQNSSELDEAVRRAADHARRENRPVHKDLVDLGLRIMDLPRH